MPKATQRTLLTFFYLSAAALVFVPAYHAGAEDQSTEAPQLKQAPVISSPFVYGMRVWIDPETGQIRQPTKAEREAVAERRSEEQRLNKSSEGLVVEYREDGSRFVDLQGRFMHSLVLTRNADGTLTAHCDDSGHDHDMKTTDEKTRELPIR
jgi:hypothetical protein